LHEVLRDLPLGSSERRRELDVGRYADEDEAAHSSRTGGVDPVPLSQPIDSVYGVAGLPRKSRRGSGDDRRGTLAGAMQRFRVFQIPGRELDALGSQMPSMMSATTYVCNATTDARESQRLKKLDTHSHFL